MSKHTKGPWAFTEGDAKRMAMSNVFKADDPEFLIAYVTCEWQNPHQRAEDIANARIIAAAPEMLAVLVALVNDDDIAQGFGGLYTHLQKLRDMARPVLNKVEGIR